MVRALVFSIIIHLIFLLISRFVFSNASTWSSQEPSYRDRAPIEIKLQNDNDGQVVDIQPSRNQREIPNKARFLATHNQAVGKETQARSTGTPGPGQGQSTNKALDTLEAARQHAESGKIDLSLPDSFKRQDARRTQIAKGGSSPNNYLPGIELGDETLLNTKEYAYASYFVRMKRQMEGVWNPLGVMRIQNLDQDVYVTAVKFDLDHLGHLIDVKIIAPSGNPVLDQEALRTVRQSAPYLNPPAGIISEDGKVHIDRWSFILSRNRMF